MKKILILMLILSAVLFATGCDLIFKAANVYTRYDVNEDGIEIMVEVMHKYGDKNNIILERYYHPDGWLEREISYEDYSTGKIVYIMIFRENGDRVSAEYFNLNESSRIYETYDENGHLKTSDTYQNGQLTITEDYYPSGNRSKATYYTDPRLLFGTYIFADEDNGRTTNYYAKWCENDIIVEEYDTFNESEVRITSEMTIFASDGEFLQHYIDFYDDTGDLEKTVHYDEDGNVLDTAYHK